MAFSGFRTSWVTPAMSRPSERAASFSLMALKDSPTPSSSSSGGRSMLPTFSPRPSFMRPLLMT